MRAGYRAVVGAGVVALYATGGSVLGAGSAFAAPSDITLDSCHATVQANPGDNLVVSAKTVLAPELKDLAANPLVGQPLVAALNPVLSSLTVGSLTVQRDATSITGVEIAKQVVAALPPGIPSQGAEAVRVAVVNACQITIEKSTSAPAPKSRPPRPARRLHRRPATPHPRARQPSIRSRQLRPHRNRPRRSSRSSG